MDRKVQYTDSDGSHVTGHIERFPDMCPTCEKGIEPIFKACLPIRATSNMLQLVFQCPRNECGFNFFGFYSRHHVYDGDIWELDAREILSIVDREKFSKIINRISSDFEEIYHQAQIAEGNNLDFICGPGYRKALEFLIKDYMIYLIPDIDGAEKEKKIGIIKSTLLGTVIGTIADPQVQKCARRAAWLGNDETHYVRKWDDKDLDNLKDLIHLTVNWIDNVELAKQYEDEMPDNIG